MPSPIGHALGGVAAAWAIEPRADRRLILVCALLAISPDLDLFLPSHRTFTHSLTAVVIVFIITAVVTGRVTRGSGFRVQRSAFRRWQIAVACAAAYATHLLFDWLGDDQLFPYGIQVLWPFDRTWYISGLRVFAPTERLHLTTWPAIKQNAAAIAQEIAIVGPIVAALWLVRVKALTRLSSKMPGRDHAAK